MSERMVSGRIVGFVGLGNMGAPMAANIAAAGHQLVGYDAAGTGSRLPAGAEPAASVADLVARCDVVLLSVPDGAATSAVVAEIAAAEPRRATVVIDLSTVGPAVARDAAARLAAVGVTYADGPVSGGVSGARAGTITLMFGGPADVFERHRDLLTAFARTVVHVGDEPGHGQVMKLINNFLSATAMAATSEAMAVGLAHGLDLGTMLEVVNASTGRNTATTDKFPNRVVTGTYDTGFQTRLMSKDVRLYETTAEATGSARTVGAAVTAAWDACERAMPESDFSEIFRYVRGAADDR